VCCAEELDGQAALRAAAETLKSVGADDESILVLVDTISAKFAHISAI